MATAVARSPPPTVVATAADSRCNCRRQQSLQSPPTVAVNAAAWRYRWSMFFGADPEKSAGRCALVTFARLTARSLRGRLRLPLRSRGASPGPARFTACVANAERSPARTTAVWSSTTSRPHSTPRYCSAMSSSTCWEG
eukprot:365524-Chlamydomonas_euryale.AAC.11